MSIRLSLPIALPTEAAFRAASRQVTPTSETMATHTLSRHRIWFVHSVIALIVVGYSFDILTDTEHWPFSSYPMFSRIPREATLRVDRLFGVTRESPPRELPLVANDYLHPFDDHRLHERLEMYTGPSTWSPILSVGFARIPAVPNKRDQLRLALLNCLERYDAGLEARRHEGPPLQGIRLYSLEWQIDPWAANRDQPSRTLLLELMRPSKE